MASSEYLSGLGAPAKPGDKLTDVLTARRINALTEGTRALTRGDNLAQGPGILLKKSPVGVIISAAPQRLHRVLSPSKSQSPRTLRQHPRKSMRR